MDNLLLFLFCSQQNGAHTFFEEFLFVEQAVYLDEFRHQPDPAGPVTGASLTQTGR